MKQRTKKVDSKSSQTAPSTKETAMPSKKKVPKVATPIVPPIASSTPTPAIVGTPSVTPGTSPTTPVPTTVVVSPSLQPPTVTLPAVPKGFVPVILKQYRGAHPKAAQITALPDAITELQQSATSYANVFGAGVPTASRLAADLSTASQWTALRVELESFLVYVKSNEAITWKAGLAEIDQLDGVFKAIAGRNAALLAPFPALQKLLVVPETIGQAAAVTRARNAKAKATAAKTAAAPAPAAGVGVAGAGVASAGTGAAGATAAPAVNSGSATTVTSTPIANGGAAH